MSSQNDIRDQITDSLDDLISSVDEMRWRPDRNGEGSPAETDDAWVPPETKARFDALYATIDAFAGAIDDRMKAWADRVQGSFTDPADAAERGDALSAAGSDPG